MQVIPKDAIPSIDDPTFGTEFAGEPTDRVVVPDLPGTQARAYPLRILNFHEIANDRVGETPIAVTWCPLCGTIVVYDRRVGDRTLTFGVSGKLADDNLVMYDRETGTEWKQSLGRGIEGPLAGETLSVIPAIVTTWTRYRSIVDDPLVLSETEMESEAASAGSSPAAIDYSRDPYRRYFDSSGFGLAAHRNQAEERTWNRDDLDPKDVVLGLGTGEQAVAVPRPWALDRARVLTVPFQTQRIVVFTTDSGMYAYEHPGFDLGFESGERVAGDGTMWNAVSGQSQDGRQLDRVPTRREFAFTWQDDHGSSSFVSVATT